MQIDQEALHSYLRMYQEGGIATLEEWNFHKPISELDEYRDEIKAAFEEQSPKSVNEAFERIEKLTGIWHSPPQVRKFLKEKFPISSRL